MPNYQLGKVYKIIGNGKIYVGSTCLKLLCSRLATHNGNYRYYLKNGINYVTSCECLSDPNHYIELLEVYPCNSKDELHRCERKWIEATICVNKVIPCQLREERDLKNADKIRNQSKEYRLNNADKIIEYRLNNADKIKEYYQKNADKIKEQHKKYLLNKKNNILTV